jgi:methanogenic corrinoid protein MtbC1
MSTLGSGGELFQHDLYEKSVKETKTLKARLPVSAVESLAREVLSRLPAQFGSCPTAGSTFSTEMVEELAQALISDDDGAAGRLVSTQQAAGHSERSIYLTYLAEAARLLGAWWEADTVDFAQVTIGTARIYAILRVLAPLLRRDHSALTGKSVLLCSVPGETHTLGVKMAADLLRADGWAVNLMLDETHDTLVEKVAKEKPVLIGLSAAGSHAMPNLARLIMVIRISSPDTSIFVGGHIVAVSADLLKLTGVDAMEVEFEASQTALQQLWDNRLSPS